MILCLFFNVAYSMLENVDDFVYYSDAYQTFPQSQKLQEFDEKIKDLDCVVMTCYATGCEYSNISNKKICFRFLELENWSLGFRRGKLNIIATGSTINLEIIANDDDVCAVFARYLSFTYDDVTPPTEPDIIIYCRNLTVDYSSRNSSFGVMRVYSSYMSNYVTFFPSFSSKQIANSVALLPKIVFCEDTIPFAGYMTKSYYFLFVNTTFVVDMWIGLYDKQLIFQEENLCDSSLVLPENMIHVFIFDGISMEFRSKLNYRLLVLPSDKDHALTVLSSEISDSELSRSNIDSPYECIIIFKDFSSVSIQMYHTNTFAIINSNLSVDLDVLHHANNIYMFNSIFVLENNSDTYNITYESVESFFTVCASSNCLNLYGDNFTTTSDVVISDNSGLYEYKQYKASITCNSVMIDLLLFDLYLDCNSLQGNPPHIDATITLAKNISIPYYWASYAYKNDIGVKPFLYSPDLQLYNFTFTSTYTIVHFSLPKICETEQYYFCNKVIMTKPATFSIKDNVTFYFESNANNKVICPYPDFVISSQEFNVLTFDKSFDNASHDNRIRLLTYNDNIFMNIRGEKTSFIDIKLMSYGNSSTYITPSVITPFPKESTKNTAPKSLTLALTCLFLSILTISLSLTFILEIRTHRIETYIVEEDEEDEESSGTL